MSNYQPSTPPNRILKPVLVRPGLALITPPQQILDQPIFTPPQELASPISPEPLTPLLRVTDADSSRGLAILDHDSPRTFLALRMHAERLITAAGILKSSGTHLTKASSPYRWIGVPVIQRRSRSYGAADCAMRNAKTGSTHGEDNDLRIFLKLRQVAEELVKDLGGYGRRENHSHKVTEDGSFQQNQTPETEVWKKRQRIGEREWAWGVVGLAAGRITNVDPDFLSLKDKLLTELRRNDKHNQQARSLPDELKQLSHSLFSKLCDNLDGISLLFIVDVVDVWLKAIGEYQTTTKTTALYPSIGHTLEDEFEPLKSSSGEKLIVELAITSTTVQDPYTVAVPNNAPAHRTLEDSAAITEELEPRRGRDPSPKPCYFSSVAPSLDKAD